MRHAARIICMLGALLLAAGAGQAEPDLTPTAAFQKRLEEAIWTTEASPRMRGMSYLQRRAIIEFVAGNMLFTLLHEMGHAHITEMGLPVLGREEDAADSFAVVTMLKVGSRFSHDVLVQAATGWFLSALRDEQEGTKLAFYDVHGLDRQRAFQIVCLMVGANGDRFFDLATKVGLPEDRQETCRGDYSNASWSWETLMKPHRRADAQPRTVISTTYGKGDGDLDFIERLFRAVRLLETVADYAAEAWVWRRPFALEMQSCGAANARWDLATRKLTLCYELAAEFARLYRAYGDQVMLPLERSAAAP
jgi:hypothetical protein